MPVPTSFIADTLNVYAEALLNPVTSINANVEVSSLKVVHEFPLSDEYSAL